MTVRLDAYISRDLKRRLTRAARTESDRQGKRFSEAEIIRRALETYLAAHETAQVRIPGGRQER